MCVILSLQLFGLIRELLTDKFQLIHKVCLFKFYLHCVEIVFTVLVFSMMVLRNVFFLLLFRPFKGWINLEKDIYRKECFYGCSKGKYVPQTHVHVLTPFSLLTVCTYIMYCMNYLNARSTLARCSNFDTVV